MADKKFSDFLTEANPDANDELVGLASGNNVKISVGSFNRNDFGGILNIAEGGTGKSNPSVSLVGGLLDEASQVVGDNLVIQDDGSGNSVLATGQATNIAPHGIQLVIGSESGLSNTNNGV